MGIEFLVVVLLALSVGHGESTAAPIDATESSAPSEADPDSTAPSVGEEEIGRNHVMIFIGSTEAEEEIDGSKADPRFTVGADYVRRVRPWLGVGATLELVVEGDRELILAMPIGFYVYRGAEVQVAPGVQRLRNGDFLFVGRVGLGYEFEVGGVTVTPAISEDFSEGASFLVLGVGVGRRF